MRKILLLAGLLIAAGFLPYATAAEAPAWPSLPEQIEKGGIVPGSALARLVAANQETSLLRPDEAKDRRRLPVWLRIFWRKAHPEARYSAADPTGGYPLVLNEVLEWMLSHQDLKPGEAAEPLPPGRTATADPDHRISGLQTAPRSESDIRINFRDPSRIISASNDIEAGGHQAVYYSSDGGATWGETSLPFTGGDAFHSDPTVDWTSDGTAWSVTIGILGNTLRLRAYKSTDGGATWIFDNTLSAGQSGTDKQMIWVDHSDTSIFKDNLYVIWHNGNPVYMNRRTGPGGTWQTPTLVSHGETTGTGIGGDVKTNSAGDVFGFWPDTGSLKLWIVKSTDGGVSYGTPVRIASTFGTFDIGVPAMADRRALVYVSGGAYRSPDRNLVYAAWTDLSGAAGCTAPGDEPDTNVAATCKTRIWFTRSLDGGATWQPAVKINDQASLNDQFNPWLAVDETTGALAVIYYDTVGSAGRKKTDVYYQSSFDDGVTWSSALKVTSGQTDETVAGADVNPGNQYGDYNGLSGYAAQFFPSWTDRRNNLREEIWTAAIHDPECTLPGVPTIGTATTPGANQVQVTWTNGAPPSASFNVYRATGTCAAPGIFAKIASAVPGSSFLDTTVSGTVSYAYEVTGLDPTGFCQSALSGCVEAVATGTCNAAPNFAGLQAVTNAGTASCGLTLSWSAGTPTCAGPLTYKIYRSTSPGFTPGPANLVASGVSGTSYTDTALLNSATTYYYVVRAVDTSNGASESNTVQKSGSPTGPAVLGTLTEKFENGLVGGFDTPGWSHGVPVGSVDWLWSNARSQTPTHSWNSASQGNLSDRVLVSPSFTVQAGTALSFWHTFSFEGTVAQCYDGGTLEITTDGGAHWTPLPSGIFSAGGFNGTVNTGFGNPIAGERAWCAGTLGAMTPVNADLSSFAGTSARLRWHAGDDSVNANPGWFVDSVTIQNALVSNACTPAPGAPLAYYTLTPCRLIDTRNPAGPLAGPALAGGGAQRSFTLAGTCGVPATARALSVNLTVVGPAAAGDLRIFPSDQPTPLISAINFAAGQTRANNAILGLGWGTGTVKVQNDAGGTVQLVVDVNGYYQ